MNPARTLALAVVLTGCAHREPLPMRPAPETLPEESPLRSHSLRESDAWLRHYVMTGDDREAIEALEPRSPLAPRDRLVRSLQEGLVLHQAGDYARSNHALQWAEEEADRRFTRSVTRAAASLVVNDGVMAYTPTRAELVMVPYYRMLNYLALGDREAALVEARKANALLARLPRATGDRCREDGMLQYLAGVVQANGGEVNDALVSLRQSESVLRACQQPSPALQRTIGAELYRVARAAGEEEIADSVAVRYQLDRGSAAPGGDLLLLVENGFVAHRAEQSLHVPILPEDVEGLKSEDEAGVSAAAERITARLLQNAWDRQVWGRSWDDSPFVQWANALDGAYILKLSWPALRLEAARPLGTRVWVDDALAPVTTASDLSAVVFDEMEAQRAAVLSRMVARGVVKYLLSREIEKTGDKKGGEVAGFVLGRLSNFAANQMEQADLRSWSLLPDRISMVRVRLPEGPHRVRIETLGPHGEVMAVRDLGEVRIRRNEVAVVGERVWGADGGELPLPRAPEGYAVGDSLRRRAPAPTADSLIAEKVRSAAGGSRGIQTRTCPANVAQGDCAPPPTPRPAPTPQPRASKPPSGAPPLTTKTPEGLPAPPRRRTGG
jgi:hypothetical protein